MPDVDITGVTVGAAGVGRLDDGRVVFVGGGLPGERVRVQITDDKPRFARGVTTKVLTAVTRRREPPCVHAQQGCGGCDLQHATESLQAEMKRSVVAESLERLGKIHDPLVSHAPSLPANGHRTQLRVVVVDGRPALRRRQSHEPVPIDRCLVSHPLINELLAESDLGDADEVTLRVGARTGDRLAVVSPSVGSATFPDDVEVVGADELAEGRRAWFTEEVAGERFRISARSFFQTRPDGADALVAEVSSAFSGVEGSLIDLYGGVGLFARTLNNGNDVLLVEQNPSSVADARVNLPFERAHIICSRVESWKPSSASRVIADPSRSGLGQTGVDKVAATRAARVVLVSCDPAALGRDAGLLEKSGFRLVGSRIVDVFPQTSHIEVVSRFDRR